MASRNLGLVVLVLAVLLFAYARRIAAEETMLAQHLNDKYLDYRRATWRLPPFLF